MFKETTDISLKFTFGCVRLCPQKQNLYEQDIRNGKRLRLLTFISNLRLSRAGIVKSMNRHFRSSKEVMKN